MKPTPVPSMQLPVPEQESPRMHQLGKTAARANLCDFCAITGYENVNVQDPLLRYGYNFHFRLYVHKVQIGFSLRDLTDRKEHEIIQVISEAIRNVRITKLTP